MLKTLRSIVVSLSKKLHFLFTFCLLVNFSGAYAEGSKDLYPAGATGNRAFLYCNTTSEPAESWPFKTPGTHYIYVKAGEVIAAGSSAQGYGNAVIRFTTPTGDVYTSEVGDRSIGQIRNRAEELSGPKIGNSAGYVPFEMTVPTSMEGVWKVEFVSFGGAGDDDLDVPNVYANSAWSQVTLNSANINLIAAWDVSVRKAGSSSWLRGRLFANVLNLHLNPTFSRARSYYATHYVLTKDGRAYRIQTNGSNGVGFTFFSNSNGFSMNSVPTYKSLNESTYEKILAYTHNPTTPDNGSNVTHKIFYNKPDPDLPEKAVTVNSLGGETWLKNKAELPKISNLVIIGAEGSIGIAGQNGAYIKFKSSAIGTYKITIPVLTPSGLADRVIVGVASQGDNIIFWDGKDGKGNFLKDGTLISKLKTKLLSAEVHFPYIDMEVNPLGLIIELTDNTTNYDVLDQSKDESVYSDRIYWNDSDITGAGSYDESSKPFNSAINGISSKSNGHKWGSHTSTSGSDNSGTGLNSFGNAKSLDTWAYIQGSEEDTPVDLIIKVADLKIESIIPDISSFLVDKQITYTIRVKNMGPSSVLGSPFAFTAPSGFNIIGNSFSIVTEEGAVNNIQKSGGNFSAILDMKDKCVIEFKVTAKSNVVPSVYPLSIESSILRPADVTDPDATHPILNPDPNHIMAPSDPHLECLNGTLTESCNNIKYNDIVVREVCSNSLIAPIEYALLPGGTEIEITDLPDGLTFKYVNGKVVIDTPPTIPGEFTFTIGTKGNDTKKTTVLVRVKPRGVAADIEVTGQVVCLGENATLKASSTTVSAPEFIWYKDAALTDEAGRGATLELPTPAADVKYYVTVKNASTCENLPLNAKEVKITVKPRGVAADIEVTGQVICLGENATLKASSTTVSAPEFIWYKDAALTDEAGRGATLELPTPTTDVKYYVTVKNTGTCENLPLNAKEVMVKVKPRGVAADIEVTGQVICLGENATLKASSTTISAPEFIWYKDAGLTNEAGRGAILELPTPAADVKYYVTVKNTGTCENLPLNAKEVMVKVKPRGVAADIEVTGQVICLGENATLKASSTTISAPEFIWYKDAGLTNEAGRGAILELPTPAADVKYYVTVKNTGTCENLPLNAKEVMVKVKPRGVAADIEVTGQVVCLGENATLKASSTTISAPEFIWYKDAALTDEVGRGAILELPTPAADVKYYVTVKNTGTCENLPLNAKEVKITVKPRGVAADIEVTGQVICLGENATLKASSTTVSAPEFIWYKDASLTNEAGRGATLELPTPAADVKYYVTVKNTGTCENLPLNAKEVMVKVKPRGVAADIEVTGQVICLGENATLKASSITISAPEFIWYKDAGLTNEAGRGATLELLTPATDVKYYVTVKNTGTCENLPLNAKEVMVKVKPRGVAADIEVTGQVICLGENATLKASSITISAPEFIWYKDAGLTNEAGRGATLELLTPATDVKYYVTVKNTGTCENLPLNAKEVMVKVKPRGVAADIEVTGQVVCLGENATLKASSTTISAPEFIWYKDAALTDEAGRGAILELPTPAADVKYYVTVKNTGTCENLPLNAKEVKITVKPRGVATDIEVTGQVICLGENATLKASSTTVSAPEFIWYKDAGLTNEAGRGATLELPTPAADVKYYVTVKNTGTCENLPLNAKEVMVKVKPRGVAADIEVTGQVICLGENATLKASSTTISAPEFIWYKDAALTDEAGRGAILELPTPAADVKYYVTVKNTGTCENLPLNAKEVMVKVKPRGVAADIEVTGQVICLGENATLKASSITISAPEFIWYKDAGLTNEAGRGATLELPTPATDVKYYVTVKNTGTCENLPLNAKEVMVKVKPRGLAADIEVTGQVVCLGENATLKASSTTISAPEFIWYKDAALTDEAGRGAILELPTPAADVKYYVTVKNTGTCENLPLNAKEVMVKVKPRGVAADIEVTGQVVCLGENATLKASSTTISAPEFIWYKDAALTDEVGRGAILELPTPAADVKYYVTVKNTGTCENLPLNAKEVKITVKPRGVAADIEVTGQVICLGENATLKASSTTVSAPEFIWYKDAGLTNEAGRGATLELPTPAADVKYYVTVKNTGTCENLPLNAKEVMVKVKPRGVAADIEVTGQVICLGENATLKASSITISAPEFIWYKDAGLTNEAGRGATLELLTPATDVKYYVTVKNTGTCENLPLNAKEVMVKVKPRGLAADIEVTGQVICLGENATLKASSITISAPEFIWYKDAGLTNEAGRGATLELLTPATDVKYYVTVKNTGTCENLPLNAKEVMVKVKPRGLAADIEVTGQVICLGENATLKASSTTISAPEFIWYKDVGLTNEAGRGAILELPTPAADVKYYVTVKNTGTCENLPLNAKEVKITVKPRGVAADIEVTGQVICLGENATLKASSTTISAPEFIWYKDAALTDEAGRGAILELPTPAADVKYYVTVKNTSTCENLPLNAKEVKITVKPRGVAADIEVTGQVICLGENATLKASSTTISAPEFIWYKDAALTDEVGRGAILELPTPAADVKYYVTVKNTSTCENLPLNAKEVKITVKPRGVAADIEVTGQVVCLGENATLKASSTTISAPEFIWYKDAALTDEAGRGAILELPTPAADVKYYVTVKNTGTCENLPLNAKEVMVKVKPRGVAADIEVTGQVICLGENATLKASSTTISAPEFIWYKDAALTDEAGRGAILELPTPAADVKYYVTVKNTGTCENLPLNAKEVMVKVKPRGVAADIEVTGQVICLGENATLKASSTTISAPEFIWYKDAALTNEAGRGATLELQTPAADVKYYVTVKNAGTCENVVAEAKVVSVKVKPKGLAADIRVSDKSICLGESVTLEATSTISNPEFTWYSDAALTDRVGTGSSFEVVAPTTDVKYYVTVKNTNTCENVVAEAKVVMVKVKPKGLAADIQVDDQAICLGSSVTLNATSAITGAVFTWYSDAALTDRVGTGSSFEVVAPTADVKYYVTVKNTNTCENVAAEAKVVMVKVKPKGLAADIRVDDQAICLGSSVTLNATSAITGAVFTWYSDAALTDRVGTGSSFEVVKPAADVKYYVTVKNTNTCENVVAEAKVVSVKVKPKGLAADIRVSDKSICLGESVTLEATSTISNPEFTWYSDAALTDRVGTGSSFEVVAPTADVKYYVTVKNTNTCENVIAEAKVVMVKVKPKGVAADIRVSDKSICLGESVTLEATSTISNPEFTWYSDPALTDPVGTGASFAVVAPTTDVKYYVTVKNAGTCENVVAEAKVVTVKVKPKGVAADIRVDDKSICLGESVTLEATSTISNPEFTWYSDAALTDPVGTGSSFEVVAPTADVKYYVTVKNTNTCENVIAEAKVVMVKVKPKGVAADIEVTGQAICLGSSVTLNATSTITGAVFNWYTDAQLRNKVYTGSDYPVTPTITTTYYVTVQSTAVCENLVANVKEVTVTVQKRGLASDIRLDDQTICLGSSATLKAISSITGAIFTWYTDAQLRNKVYIGSDYPITPTITTTYYVTVKNTITCENLPVNAKTVKVIVNPLPSIPTITSRTSTSFCEGGSTILTSSALTGNQWYKNNILIPNATAQTYTATESGSYTVIQTNTNGCISPASLPITVTENLFPVIPGISPSGTTTFCDGGVVTLTSSSTTGNQWYKGGILIPGATNPTYNVSEIGVYTVNVTNTAGCASANSASTTVTVSPVPKGFDDQINTLNCRRSTFTYDLQALNINNTIKGGNGVLSSFTWTVNPTTISGAASGSGNAIAANLINTGMSPEEVIYTVTPRGLSGGCDGLPFKIKVLVPVCSAISITKTADRSSVDAPGTTINYTITVSNVANASHHNLIVNDPLTGGNLSNPTGDNGNNILEKGEFWTYHTSYTVTQTDLDNNGAPDTDLGEVQNIATVKTTESPTPRTAVANVAIRQTPVIRLVKTGVLNQDYRTIDYTFLITNKGNVTLKDLKLTDPKLPGLSISNLTELSPGASTSVTATYTIKEIEKRAGTVINTAKVTGTYNLGSRVSDISGTNENNDDPTVVDIIRYPSAVDDFAKTKADIEVMVPVTNNDRPSLFPLDVATVDVKAQPINGKLQLNRDGKVVYHPNKGYVGLETFTYMVNDDNGLPSNVAVVTINVVPADLEIPNTFTPNGDGKNDTFLIKGRENYESIEISIFNRWGDEVYKSKNYKDEWDGAGLNEGTYFYVLRLKKAGKEEIRRSWVLIKR